MSRHPPHRPSHDPVETDPAGAVGGPGQHGHAGRATSVRRARAPAGVGVLGFVIRFGLYWALALGVISQVPAIERWAVNTTVANLSLILRALTVKTVISNNFIQAGRASIEIVPDCTALMPTLVFWAAVAAFPTPWRRRVAGLVMGAVAVWAFNLLRVIVLIAVLWWMPKHFGFVHVYLWQAGTLLVVSAMFMYWARLQVQTIAER